MAEFTDKLFSVGILTGSAENIKDVLQLNPTTDGHINTFANGSTIIINSDRLIFNAKKDHTFICGSEGVTITTPKSIHIDCVEDLYLFSETGEIYLGLPNKGREYKFDNERDNPTPKKKSDPTKNVPYEPILLGLKTANLIEDLIAVLVNMTVRTPAGDGYLSTEIMYNLESLRSRIPEILSTSVFVEGVSHDQPDAAPPVPPEVETALAAATAASNAAGNVVSTSTSTVSGTTANNTQAPAQSAAAAYQSGSGPTTNPDGKITN